jgi:hypothetical protein
VIAHLLHAVMIPRPAAQALWSAAQGGFYGLWALLPWCCCDAVRRALYRIRLIRRRERGAAGSARNSPGVQAGSVAFWLAALLPYAVRAAATQRLHRPSMRIPI